MTTLLGALSAIERGDPFALRMAVEAMGDAIDVLGGEASAATDSTIADAAKVTANAKRRR